MDRFCLGDGDDIRYVFQATLLSDLEFDDIRFCEESEIEIGNFGNQE